MAQTPSPHCRVTFSTGRASDERSAARQTETPAEQAMPTFEFYTLLPETEVIAPGGAIPSTKGAL